MAVERPKSEFEKFKMADTFSMKSNRSRCCNVLLQPVGAGSYRLDQLGQYTFSFYCEMLYKARLCYGKSSVCLTVCDVCVA